MRKEVWILAAIIMLGIAIRLVVMLALSVYNPPIDAFIVNKESANVILHLQNPYTYSFPVHDYYLNTFAYLPMVPIYYAPFYVLGDFRYGSIFADVLIMLAAFWIAKSYNRRFGILRTFGLCDAAPIYLAIEYCWNQYYGGNCFFDAFLCSVVTKKIWGRSSFLGFRRCRKSDGCTYAAPFRFLLLERA